VTAVTRGIGGVALGQRTDAQALADFDITPSRLLAGITSATLDGSASCDPDNAITSYKWEYPNDEGSGQTDTHTFNDLGESVVSLTVTTDNGGEDSTDKSVSVQTPVVDDFEDDLSAYSVVTSAGTYDYQLTNVEAFKNSQSLELYADGSTSAAVGLYGDPDKLDTVPARGDIFKVRIKRGDHTKGFHWQFGKQTAGGFAQAYEIRARRVSGNFAIAKRAGGNFTEMASTTVSYPSNEWMEFTIEWADDGTITATVEDASGTELGSISATDTTYETGGVLWYTSACTGGNCPVGEAYTYYDGVEVVGEA
jgi:hypothetical protein